MPAGLPARLVIVGLADRLDTLGGLFAAGLAPTGTKDPFAQRRAALGLVQILGLGGFNFDLREGLRLAEEELPLPTSPETLAACLEFIVGRLRSYLMEREEGFRYDVVDAVLSRAADQPGRRFTCCPSAFSVGRPAGLDHDFAGLCSLCAHHPRSERALYGEPGRLRGPGREGAVRGAPYRLRPLLANRVRWMISSPFFCR